MIRSYGLTDSHWSKARFIQSVRWRTRARRGKCPIGKTVNRSSIRLNSHEIFFDPRRVLRRRRTPSDVTRESYDSKRCQKLNECAQIGKAFRKLDEHDDADRRSLRVIGLYVAPPGVGRSLVRDCTLAHSSHSTRSP